MKPNRYGITNLNETMLSTVVPSRVHGGGELIGDVSEMLFLWRSCGTEKAKGATLSFFLDDSRLRPLSARPERYSVEFRHHGIAAVVEPDFSMWADQSLEDWLHNARIKKIVARQWQEAGLLVAPNLNWSRPESFDFAFAGTPIGCPVAFTECRTASSSAEDRKAFSHGLHEAIRRVQPRVLVIYGGQPHRGWIERDLPVGPAQFVFLESWTDSRGKVRKAQERQVREEISCNYA
jgi:hypothetical protein